MDLDTLHNWYNTYKESSIHGRYIHLDHITPLIEKHSGSIGVKEIGVSENGAPIHLLTLGTGTKKLFFWSQMHGNESTTTKAVFDVLNLLTLHNGSEIQHILDTCTLYIIPILNPDGAKAYTRLNFNQVDLNRDAQSLTQKESNVLLNQIKDIQPNYCFNLHGQRTIFSAGSKQYSATVSFLSPAGDQQRSITSSRKVSMEIVAEMNSLLQQCIPNQVGRYDDGFNINCVGDTLESLEIPTILFEAGHYQGDYDRDITRMYIFYSLVCAIGYISEHNTIGEGYKKYFEIPENEKWYYDVIIRDVILNDKNVDIALQYTEKLIENNVNFIPKVVEIGNLEKFSGHREILGKERKIRNENVAVEIVQEVELLSFYLNSELFSTEVVKR